MNHKITILTALASLIIANSGQALTQTYTEEQIFDKINEFFNDVGSATSSITVVGNKNTSDPNNIWSFSGNPNGVVVQDFDDDKFTETVDAHNVTLAAEVGNDYQEVRASGRADQAVINTDTSMRTTLGFAIVGPIAPFIAPEGPGPFSGQLERDADFSPTPIKIDITFSMKVGSSEMVPGISNGSNAIASYQGPESAHRYVLGVGPEGLNDAFIGPYEYDSETGMYTKSVTITDTTTVMTNLVNTFQTTVRVFTHTQAGVVNEAFAWLDPVITVNHSVLNWQDYTVIMGTFDGTVIVDSPNASGGGTTSVPDTGSTLMLFGMASHGNRRRPSQTQHLTKPLPLDTMRPVPQDRPLCIHVRSVLHGEES